MNIVKTSILIIVGITLLSCKENSLEDYKIDDASFIAVVHPELIYQQHLNQELQQYSNDTNLANLGLTRSRNLDNYLSELKSITTAENWANDNISDEHELKLQTLDRTQTDYKARLLTLLVETDQNMIGYHVKAVNPQGLKNEALRVWADQKIPYLQQNLRETQVLKP